MCSVETQDPHYNFSQAARPGRDPIYVANLNVLSDKERSLPLVTIPVVADEH